MTLGKRPGDGRSCLDLDAYALSAFVGELQHCLGPIGEVDIKAAGEIRPANAGVLGSEERPRCVDKGDTNARERKAIDVHDASVRVTGTTKSDISVQTLPFQDVQFEFAEVLGATRQDDEAVEPYGHVLDRDGIRGAMAGNRLSVRRDQEVRAAVGELWPIFSRPLDG